MGGRMTTGGFASAEISSSYHAGNPTAPQTLGMPTRFSEVLLWTPLLTLETLNWGERAMCFGLNLNSGES